MLRMFRLFFVIQSKHHKVVLRLTFRLNLSPFHRPLANTALPTGSGFIRQGEGHVDVITTSSNTSDSRTFFQVFDVAALGAFSPYPRIYKKATYTVGITGDLIANIVTFPVYTVIITLEKGVISSISYDDGCFFCAENSATCGFNSINANSSFEIGVESLRGCSKSLSECTAPSSTTTTTNTVTSSSVSSSNLTNSTNVTMTSTSNTVAGNSTFPSNTCDLKVFVVWQGTDRKGNYCTSVNKRFSRYRQFNVATAYQSALNLQAQGLDIAKSAINVAQSIPGQIGINGNDEVGRRLRGDKESKELEETVDDSMEV